MTLQPTDRARVRLVDVPASDDAPAHVAVFVEAHTEADCLAEVSRLMGARGVAASEFRHPLPTALDTWVAVGYQIAH